MKYTRKQYLANECNHQEYYVQFVTEQIKAIVKHNIGNAEFIASKLADDQHLNNIPLAKWDKLATIYPFVQSIDENGDGKKFKCLSNGVCVLKAAAKIISQEDNKNGN